MRRRAQLELFGGKGGVGKTTCAASRALRACDAGERVLVVSTDPAHSLADVLGVRVRARPTAVRVGRRTMHALELDADGALGRWLRARRTAFRTIAERGTYLDEEDVDRLMALSLPGVDELAGLLELRRLERESEWDRIVVDTAPTGHTLRLLETPEALARIANVLDEMQAKHRLLAESLAGRYRPDDADATIAEIAADADELRALLTDPARCSLAWVTLPEPMSIEETADALRALEALGVQATRIVVNRVTPAPERPCPQCTPRVRAETRAIQRALTLADADVQLIAAQAEEPRGVKALRSLREEEAHGRIGKSEGKRVTPQSPPDPPDLSANLSSLLPPTARLVLFGGKGGVGKTTCAAAAAVALASGKRRVLLLSTDPAHSLADALGVALDDEVRPVPGARGLFARELDARASFDRERERYRDAVDEAFRSLLRSPTFDATYDRAVMEDLIDLAPPGIDEVLALVTLLEAVEDERYGTVIVDTAPTGHTLRLLAMPAAARGWIQALLAILLKYRRVLGLGELASDLLRWSKKLRAFGELLGDRRRTAFVAVTRAAKLPRWETVRLVADLERASVPVPALVVDAVTRGDCRRCRAAALVEATEVAALTRSSKRRGRAILLAPAEYPAPHGVESLGAWVHRWTVHGSA